MLSDKTDLMKKCINEKSPSEIFSQYDYDDYSWSRDNNKKLFKQHYFDKWICNFEWNVTVVEKPEKNDEGYWVMRTEYDSYQDDVNIKIRLSYGIKPDDLNKGDKIKVTGRIIDETYKGLVLSEASYIKNNDN